MTTAELDPEAFIKEQLEGANIFYRMERHDFRIDCPWKPSESGQQKLSLKTDGSKLHCWSCHVTGSYNTLADKLGLKKLPASTALAYKAVERAIDEAEMDRGIPSMPKDLKPYTEEYRGMSPDFLKKFDSKKWYDLASSSWRILWPVTYNGQLQGWTAGATDKRVMPKYCHGPSGVFQTRRALWPMDCSDIRNVVVLTEGPFDALRLLHEGIPAMSILGAGNWHSAKGTMLKQRKRPIDGIIIALDGDDEGWEGTKTIYRSVRDNFEAVKIFQVPEGKDPGDMSQKFVEQLRGEVLQMREELKAAKSQKAAG